MGWKEAEPPRGKWVDAGETFNRNVQATKRGLKKEARGVLNYLGFDKEVDYMADVGNPGLRMALSAADTPEERERVLNAQVGPTGWSQDPAGRYVLNPVGLSRIGVDAQRPRAIDALRPTVGDVYDWHGDVGSIGGGLLGAGAAVGAGFPVLGVMGMAGLAAMGGMGYQEAIEEARGQNLETSPQIGMRMGKEGLLATLGEGFQGTLASPLGRKLEAPYRSGIDESTLDAVIDARQMGVHPSFNQVKPHPLVGRAARVAERVFGEKRTEENAVALYKELHRMLDDMSIRAQNTSVTGRAIKDNIRGAKKSFSDAVGKRYTAAEALIGDTVRTSTSRLKKAVAEVYEDLPKTPDGAPILTDPQTTKWISDIASLPDQIPVKQMRAVRTHLFDSIDNDQLLVGLPEARTRRLHRAATEAIEDIRLDPGTPEKVKIGVKNLQIANRKYREGLEKFDDVLIKNITKREGRPGAVDPEMVVDSIFKPRHESKLRRVMQHLPEEVKGDVRRNAFENMMSKSVTVTDDITMDLLDGRKLYTTLQRYGKPTLKAMFGSEMTDNMFRFARVARVASRKQRDQGGLVAAAIATRPFKNLGRLAQLGVVHKLFQTKAVTKWLTTGLEAPNTKEGIAALSRVAIYVNALVDEETAKVSGPPPETQR